jgi:hypothetical protein
MKAGFGTLAMTVFSQAAMARERPCEGHSWTLFRPDCGAKAGLWLNPEKLLTTPQQHEA